MSPFLHIAHQSFTHAVVPSTSVPGLQLVVSFCGNIFSQLKVNVKPGRFVVKGLIVLCVFTFCVEVELVRLIFNIVGSLIS